MTGPHIRQEIATLVSRVDRALAALGIDATGFPLGHVCYRVETLEEHRAFLERSFGIAREIAAGRYNGRSIAMIQLELAVPVGARAVGLVEVPEPRAAHPYRTGWEHVGYVVGAGKRDFDRTHGAVLDGVKDRGPLIHPSFVNLPGDVVAKFYELPLRDVVLRGGWTFAPVAGIRTTEESSS